MFKLMEPREMDARVDDVPRMLLHIHESVHDRLRNGAIRTHLPLRKNAKGDAQQPYDVVADATILRVLEKHAGSGILWSEETGEIRFGDGRPLYRFVVDPVDGSDNWGRGLPLSAVSVAVLPADSPITPARVCWAMVGDLRERLPLTARRGYGGYHGSRRIRTSGVQTLSTAFLSCELNHFDPPASVGGLLQRARGVRALWLRLAGYNDGSHRRARRARGSPWPTDPGELLGGGPHSRRIWRMYRKPGRATSSADRLADLQNKSNRSRHDGAGPRGRRCSGRIITVPQLTCRAASFSRQEQVGGCQCRRRALSPRTRFLDSRLANGPSWPAWQPA